ncbi:type III-B CRISPR module-associated protein Cmr5 [Endozoicomonas gorgoniicola]|uniref:CRISPR type III-B/RAMP module-associated protein Cmr5 n=1 Tax=Endozoicomonas gorgoniicola TaxID=1234144 RepID=A0ABT3MSE0_9GAMM|nr:type III-B CRISPR module-associated protein Cmr5 [Endozoicomonas gorgoniicola]MCW7552286.1 type III-B CRISPR module-associated protein Cmr5 [Endozoicomonas gorgoniicola]
MSLEVKAVNHRRSDKTQSSNMTDTPQTMQQKRAAFCYRKVKEMAGHKNQDAAKRFKAYANSLPAMVQMNGLGQTLAFAKSKCDSGKPEGIAWQHLYDLISEWHGREEGCYTGQDVLEGIMSSDMHVYRQAQAETQALMVWVKQFARAEIKGSD